MSNCIYMIENIVLHINNLHKFCGNIHLNSISFPFLSKYCLLIILTHPAFVATVPVLFLAATAAALYTFFLASFLEVLFTSFLAVEMFCKIQQLHLTMIFSIAKIIHLGILRIIILCNVFCRESHSFTSLNI